MQQTDNDSWLDVLPALPLARGVPVAHLRARWRGVVAAYPETPVCTVLGLLEDSAHGAELYPCEPNNLRVDLGDLQGFGYALRQLAQLTCDNRPAHVEALLAQLTNSWLNWRDVNDNDRRRLASALDEVVRGL